MVKVLPMYILFCIKSLAPIRLVLSTDVIVDQIHTLSRRLIQLCISHIGLKNRVEVKVKQMHRE